MTRATFSKNVAVMVFNHFFHDRKTDAGALILRVRMQSGKKLENAVGVFLIESYSVVCYLDAVEFYIRR